MSQAFVKMSELGIKKAGGIDLGVVYNFLVLGISGLKTKIFIYREPKYPVSNQCHKILP